MKTFLKVMNIVSTVLVALIALVLVAFLALRIFGLQGYAVKSGSMEPEYPTGSAIYVKEVDPKELEVGDVITYYLKSGQESTHRIVEVVEEKGSLGFITKGDANDQADGNPVAAGDIIGTPVFTVPYLGYALLYMQTTQGTYVTIAVVAALLLVILLPSLLQPEKGSKKQKNNNIEEENQ